MSNAANRAGKSRFVSLCAMEHTRRTGKSVVICGPNGQEKWTLDASGAVVKEPMSPKPDAFKVWLDELLESNDLLPP